jgi:hypothetical protein
MTGYRLVLCPYCFRQAEMVLGKILYPDHARLAEKLFWKCPTCDAHVGCHPGSTVPMGTLANKALRALRSKLHSRLDPLWRDGRMTRDAAYAWMATLLSLTQDECHIGLFTDDQCKIVLEALDKQ